MNYATARPLIRTGDLIGVQTGTPASHIIHAGQRIAGLANAHITHTAIAVWLSDRLFAFEMGPSGNTFKLLSQYAGHRMTVSEPPPGTSVDLIHWAIDKSGERHIPYGWLDLVRIALRVLPLRLIDTRGWGGDGPADKPCSLLPAVVYRLAEGDVSVFPALAAPAEAVNALPLRFEIEAV